MFYVFFSGSEFWVVFQAQAEVIGEHRDTLPSESLPGFKVDVKNARKEARSTMYGNGRVIKRINRVDSGEPPVQTLTQPLGIAGDDENTDGKRLPTINLFARSPSDPINVGSPSQVTSSAPTRIFQIFSSISGATKLLDQLCSEQNIGIFRANINTWIDNAWRAFKTRKWTELEINGIKIFQNLHPFEEDRLGQVMQAPGNDFNPEITEAAVSFAKRQKCKNSTEFVNIVEQVSTYVNDNAPTPVVRNLLLTDLKNPKSESFKDLVTRFQIKTELQPFAMTYHFYRYTSDCFRELTQFEEHLKICRELFGEEVNSNNAIFSETHEGHVTVTYIDEKDTLYSIVICHLPHTDDITYFKTTVSILAE